jgi:hypothetical protein
MSHHTIRARAALNSSQPLRGYHRPVPQWYTTAREIAEAVAGALAFVFVIFVIMTAPTWGPVFDAWVAP